jgi:hypothetical protein
VIQPTCKQAGGSRSITNPLPLLIVVWTIHGLVVVVWKTNIRRNPRRNATCWLERASSASAPRIHPTSLVDAPCRKRLGAKTSLHYMLTRSSKPTAVATSSFLSLNKPDSSSKRQRNGGSLQYKPKPVLASAWVGGKSDFPIP